MTIQKIYMLGSPNSWSFITKFKLKYTLDLINWNDYKDGEEINGNTDNTQVVKV